MKLTSEETAFLTALAREQTQTGCHGLAHDLLRRHAYPDAPLTGPGSLAFSYEASPLTGLLMIHFKDLQEVADFLRREERNTEVSWPWASAADYRARLSEVRRVWTFSRRRLSHSGASDG